MILSKILLLNDTTIKPLKTVKVFHGICGTHLKVGVNEKTVSKNSVLRPNQTVRVFATLRLTVFALKVFVPFPRHS